MLQVCFAYKHVEKEKNKAIFVGANFAFWTIANIAFMIRWCYVSSKRAERCSDFPQPKVFKEETASSTHGLGGSVASGGQVVFVDESNRRTDMGPELEVY